MKKHRISTKWTNREASCAHIVCTTGLVVSNWTVIVESRELTVLVVLKIFQGLEKAFGTVVVKVVNKTLHLSARIRDRKSVV